MAARTKGDLEATVGVGSVALVASIFGNLKQFNDKQQLTKWIQALQRVVRDLQISKQNLKAQLDLTLRTNEDQNRLIATLREQVSRAEARAYDAERRALEPAKPKATEGRT